MKARLVWSLAMAAIATLLSVHVAAGPHHFTQQAVDTPNPTLRLFERPPGVDNLNPNLTINGITETPVFRYKGGDADGTDWDAWGYGSTIPAIGSGGVFNDGSPLLGVNDDSVNADGTRSYEFSSPGTYDISTEDIIVEAVFKAFDPGVDFPSIFEKRTTYGYKLDIRLTGTLALVLDGVGALVTVSTAALGFDTWYHAIGFFDKSGSGQWYINGAASGSSAVLSSVGSLASPDTFAALSTDGGDILDSNVSYMALWKRDTWLDTHLQPDVAKERFLRLTGAWPAHSNATTETPTFTRATHATVDKLEGGVRKLYKVGAGWPRYVQREDSGSTTVSGYLPEIGSQTVWPTNRDFSSASWTFTNASIAASSPAVEAPDGSTVYALSEDSTSSAEHYMEIGGTGTILDIHTMSVLAKAANRDWLRMYSTGFLSNGEAYFDLSDCSLGTATANFNHSIEDWGDGWCRCMVQYQLANPVHVHRISPAEADGDNVFDGLGQESTYVFGAMHELHEQEIATSVIINDADANFTRNADVLEFDLTGQSYGVGSMRLTALCPTRDLETGDILFMVSDGSISNYVRIIGGASSQTFFAVSDAPGGSLGAIDSNIFGYDNTVRGWATTWQSDNLKFYADGALLGTDISVDAVSGIDTLDVGHDVSNTVQPGCVLSTIVLYPTNGQKARK